MTGPRVVTAAVAVLAGLLGPIATAPPAGAVGYELIRTVAGNGQEGSTGDGGPAIDASIDLPRHVAAEDAGNFYFTELFSGRVRRVDTSGVITTVAGGGDPADGVGDNGPATSARLDQPSGVALDGSGNIFVADGNGQRVRRVGADGIIATVAGTGQFGYTGDGGLATQAQIANPTGLEVDAAGNLYIAQDQYNVVRRVDTAGIITTVAGGVNAPWGVRGDGGLATEAFIDFPMDVDTDAAGNLYIADSGGNTPGLIRKVNAATGIITTIAGGGSPPDEVGDDGPGTEANLAFPRGVVLDEAGNVYIADTGHHRIRRVDTAGVITTIAGTGSNGFSGDGGSPTEAELNDPWGIETDPILGLLLADSSNSRIRQVVTVPDLVAVIKSDTPDPLNIDEQLTYTIQVTNNSTESATGVVVTDPLPASVDFGSASATQGTCSQTAGTVTCLLGEMATGATATVTITVTPRTPGVLTNTATVSADGDDPAPGNDSATAVTSVGDRGCGQIITRSTVLSEDVGPCPANGIIIGADRITLDLGGHRVFGFDGPGDGNAGGIRLPNRTGVTVTNGTVSGFDAGVVLNQGRANTVSRMNVRDNIGPDDRQAWLGDGIILFDSSGNSIVGNLVVHNGVYDGIGVLGTRSNHNTISGNTVEDTVGALSGGAPAGQGIILSAPGLGGFDPTLIIGNTVKNNVVRRNASAGIANINNAEGSITLNTVEGNGLTGEVGNGIGVQVGPGVEKPDTHLLVQSNQVHGNGEDGITVTRRADRNQVVNNNATNNGRKYGGQYAGVYFFDLRDGNYDQTGQPSCLNNVWRNNRWGNGGYDPACAAAGGKGPRFSPRPGSAPSDPPLPPGRRAPSER